MLCRRLPLLLDRRPLGGGLGRAAFAGDGVRPIRSLILSISPCLSSGDRERRLAAGLGVLVRFGLVLTAGEGAFAGVLPPILFWSSANSSAFDTFRRVPRFPLDGGVFAFFELPGALRFGVLARFFGVALLFFGAGDGDFFGARAWAFFFFAPPIILALILASSSSCALVRFLGIGRSRRIKCIWCTTTTTKNRNKGSATKQEIVMERVSMAFVFFLFNVE